MIAHFDSSEFDGLRVAIIHYWYVYRRGGERVLETLAEMFPQADIFTMVVDRSSLPPSLSSRRIYSSFIQKIPGALRHYRKMMFLFPMALESFCLDDYDLVLSHEAGPAKGVLTRAGTCHICYSHSPMRHVWEMYHHYRRTAPGGALGRLVYDLSSHYVRQWDFATAGRVDYFVASSCNGASRIRKYYRRDAEIVYPPVDVRKFTVSSQRHNYYLVVSPLVAYKRVDLAIKACNILGRKLAIIGRGEELANLRRLAGPDITFLGYQPDQVVRDHYRRCRAFLFPGEEDIGLTPIEAQASGAPVIAYGRGGALETLNGCYPDQAFAPDVTGVFFRHATAESLAEAILAFEDNQAKFKPEVARACAEAFSLDNFKTLMGECIARKFSDFKQTLGTHQNRFPQLDQTHV